ncbi:7 transmembrane receptor (rhodopsin family) domain-containing protein [Ditylenchus destructor]|nr:7 transmembrane receptor (rhodopsin family) domain-containing protein [Ditylenchus destructor]
MRQNLPETCSYIALLIFACSWICDGYSFNGIQTNIPQALLIEKACRKVFPQGGCKCLTRVSYSRCCCVGSHITQIPQNFSSELGTLFLYNVGITEISTDTFVKYPRLEEILVDNAKELKSVDGDAFKDIKNLRKIRISNCPKLEQWTGVMLKGNLRIQSIKAQNNALKSLPKMAMIPDQHVLTMELLDFSNNRISNINTHLFENVNAKLLLLEGNVIETVESQAFSGCKFLKLSLNNNPGLRTIASDAFANISELHHLDLSNTPIDRLPVKGLKNIKHLSLKNVPRLKYLPPVLAFNNLAVAEFTYPSHCCFFKYATREYMKGELFKDHYQEIQHRICRRQQSGQPGRNSKFRKRDLTQVQTGISTDQETDDNALFNELAKWYRSLDFGPLTAKQTNGVSKSEQSSASEEEEAAFSGEELGRSVVLKKCDETAVDDFYMNVSCTPQPDALNPCEDIVSYKPLRVMIWVMWIVAIAGNVAVWVVIITVWQKRMRLHYFFMLNLSFADFLTGVYLAILAVADLKTANEYYNYAVNWQTGWGCSAAGFISVFASELSVFSMLMIAGEIYYNARHAFYGKRMSAKASCLFMGLGYTYAFIMATLPLVGVSSYQRSSICLPLLINNLMDRVYILVGLSLSAAAFFCMATNYVLINCMVRNSESPSREEDRQILLKTLVLIGTDMLCWIPTLFLGITAAVGMPLISLTNAKVCLVLVYPINSCANPLLYVFLTKIWKDAKKKAAPYLEIISRQYDKHHSVSVNKFYYTQGPGERDPDDSKCMRASLESHSKMASTMSSPLIRSPSEASTVTGFQKSFIRISVDSGNGDEDTDDSDSRRPSHVSFQDSVLFYASETRKSLSTIIRPRVSAAPEMSDISEGSSSNGAGVEAEKGNQKKAGKTDKRNLPASRLSDMKRNSNTSISRDSGRGDSFTSNTLLLARPSVVSMNWEGPLGPAPRSPSPRFAVEKCTNVCETTPTLVISDHSLEETLECISESYE